MTLIEKIKHITVFLSIRNRYLFNELRLIVPDISKQEFRESGFFNKFIEIKRRALQAFQIELFNYLPIFPKKVLDVGDSSGTHRKYLEYLYGTSKDSLSVNIDRRAVEKITRNGMRAVQSSGEKFKTGEKFDVISLFETLEHSHNPALFLKNLTEIDCDYLVMTVPYIKRSRVGLYYLRHGYDYDVYAEDEHIFELCPKDWELIIRHAGWRVIYKDIHWQYPRIFWFLRYLWMHREFEGYLGLILKKDLRESEQYKDWK